MGKIIFRKFGGKIVPIKISSEKSDSGFTKVRRITAKVLKDDGSKKYVGSLYLALPKTGISSTVQDVSVREGFKRRGIGRQLFEHAAKFAGRVGKKFIRADELRSVHQVGIRMKHGKSAFIVHGLGRYGEGSAKVKGYKAREFIAANRNLVQATTMIKKKFRRK